MSKRTGLGRGLGAFFGNDYEDAEAGKSSAKPSDEAGKKTSVRETEQEIEKKSLEELDMVLPGSKKQKKSASRALNDSSKPLPTQARSPLTFQDINFINVVLL